MWSRCVSAASRLSEASSRAATTCRRAPCASAAASAASCCACATASCPPRQPVAPVNRSGHRLVQAEGRRAVIGSRDSWQLCLRASRGCAAGRASAIRRSARLDRQPSCHHCYRRCVLAVRSAAHTNGACSRIPLALHHQFSGWVICMGQWVPIPVDMSEECPNRTGDQRATAAGGEGLRRGGPGEQTCSVAACLHTSVASVRASAASITAAASSHCSAGTHVCQTHSCLSDTTHNRRTVVRSGVPGTVTGSYGSLEEQGTAPGRWPAGSAGRLSPHPRGTWRRRGRPGPWEGAHDAGPAPPTPHSVNRRA